MKTMQERITEIRELMRMKEELEAEITAAQDEIKAQMTSENVYEYRGTDYKVTWNEVTSTRVDTAAMKKEVPGIVEKYLKTTKTRRFCIA